MTGQEMILNLKSNGYIVEIGEDNYVLSNKLKRETIEETPEREPHKVEQVARTIDKFIADCKIPFRAKGAHGSQYQLNAISLYSTKAFNKIISDGEYEYEDLVVATKAYYNDASMARVILTNYFKLGVVHQVMTEFLAKKDAVHVNEGITANNNGRICL